MVNMTVCYVTVILRLRKILILNLDQNLSSVAWVCALHSVCIKHSRHTADGRHGWRAYVMQYTPFFPSLLKMYFLSFLKIYTTVFSFRFLKFFPFLKMNYLFSFFFLKLTTYFLLSVLLFFPSILITYSFSLRSLIFFFLFYEMLQNSNQLKPTLRHGILLLSLIFSIHCFTWH